MITRPMLLRGLATSLLALGLAGCNSWLSHRETISYQAGDAVAWNRAVHTIDPWPAASRDTTIPTSGRRIARVIDAYENGETAQSAGKAGSTGFAPIAIAPGQ
ncbi:MAG TPA: hypothetical protein VGU45_12875 [Microvirga sp.]|jgi:hypothetical protein|nr:hypothetical protein [Microvirga sp.]